MFSKIFAALCLTILVTGCTSGPTIRADYDKTADFSNYKTFAFIQPLGTDQAGYESLLTAQIKSAVTSQLVAKGYVLNEATPDLLVNFNAKVQDQVKVSQTPTAPPMYYGYRGRMYTGMSYTGYETRVDQYKEGTLNIDIVDAKRKQLIWEGVAVGRLSQKSNDDRQTKINSAVQEIFMQYPFVAAK
jgi:hypothetical protein